MLILFRAIYCAYWPTVPAPCWVFFRAFAGMMASWFTQSNVDHVIDFIIQHIGTQLGELICVNSLFLSVSASFSRSAWRFSALFSTIVYLTFATATGFSRRRRAADRSEIHTFIAYRIKTFMCLIWNLCYCFYQSRVLDLEVYVVCIDEQQEHISRIINLRWRQCFVTEKIFQCYKAKNSSVFPVCHKQQQEFVFGYFFVFRCYCCWCFAHIFVWHTSIVKSPTAAIVV